MKFEKAYKEMLEGKKIRRKSWEKYQYIRYIPATKDYDESVRTYKCQFNHFFSNASIIISAGWLVLDGNGKELSFLDAFEELKNKKEITNKEWIKKGLDQYVFIDNNQFALCTAADADFMPTYQDLTSTDWETLN